MKSRVRIKKRPSVIIREIESIAKRTKGPNTVRVGLPKGSNEYPDGTSVIMVGAVHEFGSPKRNIPQRSYLRTTVNSKRTAYKILLRKLGKEIINGNKNLKEALGLLGLRVKSDVQSKIRAIKTPPLKYRKGNPLIDTAHLIQSINYEIEE